MNPTKVCMFCERWESGGIESFLNNILLHMNLQGMAVDIVTACLKDSVFTAGLEARGVHFYELSGHQRNMPRNHRMFRDLLRERKYDVVHLNLFQGLALYYAHIAKQEGVPVRIVHSHGAGLRNSRTKKLKLLLHAFGQQCWSADATDFWACSTAAARFLFGEQMAACPLSIIPNGIDTEQFRFDEKIRSISRQDLGVDSSSLLIGSVGRLSQEKNQAFLLDIFSKVIKHQPNSKLILVGDGEQRDQLKEKAHQLNIADDVIFYGATQDVPALLCTMDLFVFPSHFEGLGIAAVEAQAAGLPVLCSEGIPNETHLTDWINALALHTGPEAWAEKALDMMAKKIDRTRGAEAVKAAGFDVQDVAREIEQKYKER